MTDDLPPDRSSHRNLRIIQEICEGFRVAWTQTGTPLTIEAVLLQHPGVDAKQLFTKLLETEIELRCEAGQHPALTDYLDRFPEFRSLVVHVFADIDTQMDGREQQPLIDNISSFDQTVDDLPERSEFVEPPARIGRYLVRKRLGRGGFGLVFLAEDEQLERLVAIKVPHRKLVLNKMDVTAYLHEARAVAKLDHPHIVPVYDVGSDKDYPCYFVSKFVDGSNLASRIKRSRLNIRETVELVLTVADALHYSHKRGLVHRDIKPGNILLDSDNKPYVADFGLALREQDVGKGARYAGTPNYMSPEQARGEGHRVDGRSDIFSLGIVFYELLTGRRPFKADTQDELLEQITNDEVRPPRQIDDNIPKELERICLKALSKRTADRHTTARDFADDLRQFLDDKDPSLLPPLSNQQSNTAIPTLVSSTLNPVSATGLNSLAAAMKVVPKGLRSFDARDADFFLDLLPGPRDREGLPDSIRFWKSRIEETDPDHTFMIGLIYGPSGCGKSSLIKAGLLPRLSSDITPIYIEATALETESRLLHGLRKRCPALDEKWGLRESIAALRRGYGVPTGKKILIVIDQFEQWLHARKDEENTRLVQALRHCDGVQVQCLVLVRDDFWLAVSRFMRQLEVELIPGRNILLVDLFDADHARKVLSAFGRAFGKLPENLVEITVEQKDFIKQAVADLAQENRVICVRLALFAEMMKNRPWTPASLRDVGGTAGLGVTFLEETFSSPLANPAHRLHQKPARAVLKSLLPESGRAIKGNMRSQAELLTASGYASHPRDFDDLLRILDSDLRLITPTDPEGTDLPEDAIVTTQSGQKYYQLTHDFLVHSLRDWLTRKQKETRAGRAELRLAERTALYLDKPENRHLPSLDEYARIRLFTRHCDWTTPQRQMMKKADHYYLTSTVLTILTALLLGWGTWEYTGHEAAKALHGKLISADVSEVPDLLKEMEPHRARMEPLLRSSLTSAVDAKRRLVLSLALLPSEASLVPYLMDRLLQAPPVDFMIIRKELAPYEKQITGDLWKVLDDKEKSVEKRFRAACALALYDPANVRWKDAQGFVVDQLLVENPLYLSYWQDALTPIRNNLLPVLADRLEENKGGIAERRSIIEFYRGFSQNEPNAIQLLEERLKQTLPMVQHPRGKANLAVALASLGHAESIWPLLKHTPDPTLRSYLIERLGASTIDPLILIRQMQNKMDESQQYALILALGGFAREQTKEVHHDFLAKYETNPHEGIHGALTWTLNQWGYGTELAGINARLVSRDINDQRRWHVNPQGQTFSIVENLLMATNEVTVEQFKRFRPDHRYEKNVSTHPRSPANMVKWIDAVAYCNWLSKEEGMKENDLCYEFKNDRWRLIDGYEKRKGYRLPTVKEWERCCTAGAVTRCHYGNPDIELTNAYACWQNNSQQKGLMQTFQVATLKPNDFGFFDLHGNVSEWCHEMPVNAQLNDDPDLANKMLRGGCYFTVLQSLGFNTPSAGSSNTSLPQYGFRICRRR